MSFSSIEVFGMPSVQLESESYQPYETLIGTIEGTSSLLSKTDIKLFQERRELTINKEIYKFEDKYYLYMILPAEGDYRLEINNLAYNDNGSTGQLNFVKEILIKSESLPGNETEIITLSPGVIDSSSKNASIYITNIGTKNVSLKYLEKSLNLYPGETKKINLVLNKSFDLLKIESYKDFNVPLIYRGAVQTSNLTNQTVNVSNEQLISINLTSTIDLFKATALVGKNEEYNLTIVNLGDSLSNITILEDNGLIYLNSTKIDYFENRSIKQIFFSAIFSETGYINDKIRFFFNDSEILSIPIEINVFDDENLSQQNFINESEQQKSCGDLGGKICASNENCLGDYLYSGGLCCLGSCSKIEGEETNLLNVIVGIIIFLFVFAGAYYFYKKIKNVKKQTPEEKIKQIQEKKD